MSYLASTTLVIVHWLSYVLSLSALNMAAAVLIATLAIAIDIGIANFEVKHFEVL